MSSISPIVKEKMVRVGNPSEWYDRRFVTAKIYMDNEFNQAVIYFDPYTDKRMVRSVKLACDNPLDRRREFADIKASCFDNILNGVTRKNLYGMGFKEVT